MVTSMAIGQHASWSAVLSWSCALLAEAQSDVSHAASSDCAKGEGADDSVALVRTLRSPVHVLRNLWLTNDAGRARQLVLS
jgi:hypothetical protein